MKTTSLDNVLRIRFVSPENTELVNEEQMRSILTTPRNFALRASGQFAVHC